MSRERKINKVDVSKPTDVVNQRESSVLSEWKQREGPSSM